MEIDIANLVSALGTLAAAYFAYNQYTKNKMTDLKVEYFKKEEERKSYRRSENSARVFGELWRVLYETKADRVYIVQPHPLGHVAFLSIQFEVKRKGIAGMRENIQSLPMSEVAVFAKSLAENLFMFYSDIDSQVKDRVVNHYSRRTDAAVLPSRGSIPPRIGLAISFVSLLMIPGWVRTNFTKYCMRRR